MAIAKDARAPAAKIAAMLHLRGTGCGDVEHRPHVKRDAVVVQPLLAPLCLHPPDAVETRGKGALHGRDSDHLAGLVPVNAAQGRIRQGHAGHRSGGQWRSRLRR
jgi:hypothetical protein